MKAVEAVDRLDGETSATPPSYLVFRARPDDQQKTVVVTGAPRGGTTFAASIVARLGVPFSEGKHDAVGRRFSHNGLKESLVGKDPVKFASVCDDINRQRNVWAFKQPGFPFRSRFADCLRNPHYIMMLKEPMSVAMRSYSIRGRQMEGRAIAQSIKTIMNVYTAQLEFCLESDAPVMLISYDRAVRDRERTVRAVAQFLGVTSYDEADVLASIDGDRDYYFEASTVKALNRSPDWRRRIMGWLLGRLQVPK